MFSSSSELKEKYKDDYEKVNQLVNEFDPFGVIKIGAPLNEYDELTETILINYQNGKSREEIRVVLIRLLEDYFGAPKEADIKEPYKTNFYKALNTLLDKLEIEFRGK
jgi:hypothetical protein